MRKSMIPGKSIGICELTKSTDIYGVPYPSKDWRQGYIGEVGELKTIITYDGNQHLSFRILEPKEVSVTGEGINLSLEAQYQGFTSSPIGSIELEDGEITAITKHTVYYFKVLRTDTEDIDDMDLQRALEIAFKDENENS